jgi:hypothetical protein
MMILVSLLSRTLGLSCTAILGFLKRTVLLVGRACRIAALTIARRASALPVLPLSRTDHLTRDYEMTLPVLDYTDLPLPCWAGHIPVLLIMLLYGHGQSEAC